MGTFLWSDHHDKPRWEKRSELSLAGELRLPKGIMRRVITRRKDDAWQIDDGFYPAEATQAERSEVLWQFAPNVRLSIMKTGVFRAEMDQSSIAIEVESGWDEQDCWSPKPGDNTPPHDEMYGSCSPGFRVATVAPFIRLRGQVGTGLLRTTIKRVPEK